MQIEVYSSASQASKEAGNMMIKEIILDERITLGLSTGSTPLQVYNHMINAYENGFISFKRVKTFNLDEYIGIDRKHDQSYYRFMKKNLFDHIDINWSNVELPNNDLSRINEVAKEYNQLLKDNPIDLQILGIGTNGHIGFNEPGTPLRNETFIVELDEQTRKDNARFFNTLEDVPKFAITMGIKNIMKAKKIIVLALGEAKADAVKGMIEGPVSNALPASILQLHPDCTVILDEAAASKVSPQALKESSL